MKVSTGLTYFAVFYLGMVMLKDGTLGKFVGNIATTVQTGVQGIKPLTNIG